jgi:hypothetical protein
MKKFFIIILILGFIGNIYADKLRNSIWNIFRTECLVVAKHPNDQLFLDSVFQKLEQPEILPEEQYIYHFTEEKLIKKLNHKEIYWDYKDEGNKIIVDMGQGIFLIQKYTIANDSTLILELDKDLFFISEFAAADTVKELVGDITFRQYYSKLEE